MFNMAPTKQQKVFCAVEYAKTTSGAFAFAQATCLQELCMPTLTGVLVRRIDLKLSPKVALNCDNKRCLCVFHSTKCLLLFGERHLEHFVPTGMAGISIKTRSIQQQSMQLNHSPHTGHLEKKNKKRVQCFSDTVQIGDICLFLQVLLYHMAAMILSSLLLMFLYSGHHQTTSPSDDTSHTKLRNFLYIHLCRIPYAVNFSVSRS